MKWLKKLLARSIVAVIGLSLLVGIVAMLLGVAFLGWRIGVAKYTSTGT